MRANKKYVINRLGQSGGNALKRFGQNFLIDENIAREIVETLSITKDDVVLEIGPGLGALTEQLGKYENSIVAVDIDPMMINILKEDFSGLENVTFQQADFLAIDIPSSITKIIGNLPYYITSPIIEKVFLEGSDVSIFVAMVQREVAERLLAGKDCKDYGPLNILIKLMAETKILTHVHKECFYPIPRVESSVLVFKMKSVNNLDKKNFYNFLCKLFTYRRKTLVNNLLGSFEREKIASALQKLNLSGSIRPENLDLDTIMRLYSALT